jgi:hypothetical protein
MCEAVGWSSNVAWRLTFEAFSSLTFVQGSACFAGSLRLKRSLPSSSTFGRPNGMCLPENVGHSLPFPCANLVVMGGRAAIIGVVTRAAIQQLEGISSALGAKLTPGALRAFGIARPSGLRDVSVAAESLLNGDRGEWPMEDLVSGFGP